MISADLLEQQRVVFLAQQAQLKELGWALDAGWHAAEAARGQFQKAYRYFQDVNVSLEQVGAILGCDQYLEASRPDDHPNTWFHDVSVQLPTHGQGANAKPPAKEPPIPAEWGTVAGAGWEGRQPVTSDAAVGIKAEVKSPTSSMPGARPPHSSRDRQAASRQAWVTRMFEKSTWEKKRRSRQAFATRSGDEYIKNKDKKQHACLSAISNGTMKSWQGNGKYTVFLHNLNNYQQKHLAAAATGLAAHR